MTRRADVLRNLVCRRTGDSVRLLLTLVCIPALAVLVACERKEASPPADPDIADVHPDFLKYWQPADSADHEAWIEEPLPPGFQVIVAPLEGPVFADARGRTLYSWPLEDQRNGQAGDREGLPSSCTDEVLTVSAGLMSPYPPDLELPDLDRRKSCADVWPPVLAPADAEPVGKWSVINRIDGAGQWAYDGQPLYTSIQDRRPGRRLGRHQDGHFPGRRRAAESGGPPAAPATGFQCRAVHDRATGGYEGRVFRLHMGR